MKNLFVSVLLLFVVGSVFSQEWQTNFETAKKEATAKDEPIILVFQGSDWCAPCIKLDREIWSSEEFKKYAKSHYVMLQADFPRKKKNALPSDLETQNKALAEKYNKQGIFPFVAILDKNGKKIGETGYIKTTPKNYIKHLNSFLN